MRTTDYMGWRPDNPDYRDDAFRFGKALSHEKMRVGNLPVRVMPQKKEVDAHPVLDQGPTGSCTGHGVGLIAAIERNVTVRSPFFIYYEARRIIGETDVDNGAYIRDAIKVTNALGAPTYRKWPTQRENLFADPSDVADRDAAKRKAFSYHRLDNGDDYKSCLAAGHLMTIGFTVYLNIDEPIVEKFGIIPMPAGNDDGGHCVAIIGYDLDFKNSEWAASARNNGYPADSIPDQVYIGQNSWGADWGRSGRFVIPCEYLDNGDLADDAWTLRGFADEKR
jgi:hypothetical protein